MIIRQKEIYIVKANRSQYIVFDIIASFDV